MNLLFDDAGFISNECVELTEKCCILRNMCSKDTQSRIWGVISLILPRYKETVAIIRDKKLTEVILEYIKQVCCTTVSIILI